jgi:cystathionine beta-lyase
MHTYNFDQIIDRCGSDSIKWRYFPDEVLPLWIADMDFQAPEPVLQALHQRVDHGIFGYCSDSPELRITITERLEDLYHWKITPEMIVFTPGVVTGFNMACQAFTHPGDGLLIQTPVYPPILEANQNAGLFRHEAQLTQEQDGSYSVDFDRFDQAITDETRLFLLCNPHNPVGRVFQPKELEGMAEICLRHNLVICSDEIHSDLIFSGQQHTPIATLSPEIADRTVTLMAPSKTYNIAGLDCAYAVIPNPELRLRFDQSRLGLVGWVNVLGMTAANAAYRNGQDWLDQLIPYLEGNRDFLSGFVSTNLPGIRMTSGQATYLAWLDCRSAGVGDDPAKYFEREALVGLNEGKTFGRGGEGFVRLNFGCPRAVLEDGLERMRKAVLK